MKTFLQLVVSFFGIGFIPFAGQELVTLSAVPIFFILSLLKINSVYIALPLVIASAALYFFVIRNFEEGTVPNYLALDKIPGFLITMMFVKSSYPITAIVMGFILFRFFDRARLFPTESLHALQNGAGIPIGSSIAGIYANIILHNICQLGLLEKLPGILLY